jgi:hypothetical protein
VTASLSPKLIEQLLQRAGAHHPATMVYVDPRSFGTEPNRPDHDASGQLIRLERAGIAVAVLRRGDDLVEKLSGTARAGVAVG